MAGNFKLIETVTVGSGGQSAIAFTSIPQTYTDLLCLFSFRCSSGTSLGGVAVDLAINGSTANRTNKRFYGGGTSYGSDTPSSIRTGISIVTSTTTSSIFTNASFYISNYKSANTKTILVEVASENNSTSTSEIDVVGSQWASSSAVNSLSFTTSDGSNFVQYSTVYLYGITNS